jgi:hypothetical protein
LDIAYFRPRRPGPESVFENVVASQLQNLFASESYSLWTAGALPIGAGIPDLVAVSFKPEVFVLAQSEIATTHILAYLRTVGCARRETIIQRVGKSQQTVIRCLDDLVKIEAVSRNDDTYSLLPIWREILPEIVTIEVKVTNWKRAVEQAMRNRIFAHRSFVALPDCLARRVCSEPIFKQFGVGLLSVIDEHTVSIIRRPRRSNPRVWTYYYEVASFAARYGKA